MKLPAVIMTEEEILESMEESLDAERDWLEKYEQSRRQRKSVTVPPKLLSTPQAARYLHMSEWQLRRLVRDGEIPFIPGKYWKFDVADLDKWISDHRERRTL